MNSTAFASKWTPCLVWPFRSRSLAYPQRCYPKKPRKDGEKFDAQARLLVQRFKANFDHRADTAEAICRRTIVIAMARSAAY